MNNKNLNSAKSTKKNYGEIFDTKFFNKRFLICCILSSSIAVVMVFTILRAGLEYHDKQIDGLSESYSNIENRIKTISDSLNTLSSSIEELRTGLNSDKENSAYIYKTLSSLQKDIFTIKDYLHVDTNVSDESIKKLPSTKSSFIEAFETLIKEGAPFDSFIESYANQIDLKKYQTSTEVVKFSKMTIKPLEDLKKDMVAIGYRLFQTNISESFWEKQKRIFKEKFSEAIKIRKTDENAKSEQTNLSDKQKFEAADKCLSDGNFEQALKNLEGITLEDNDLQELIVNMRKRLDLENSFNSFKKEFLDTEVAER